MGHDSLDLANDNLSSGLGSTHIKKQKPFLQRDLLLLMKFLLFEPKTQRNTETRKIFNVNVAQIMG